MELNVFERIILLNVLPREGNFATLKILRQLRENLSFDEAENKALAFREENGRVQWKSDGDKPKEVEIGEKATDIVVETLKELDKQRKLTDEHFSLYEKFIGD